MVTSRERRPAIAGFAQSVAERTSTEPLGDTITRTVREAVADAGLTMGKIDGLVTCAGQPTAASHHLVDGLNAVSNDWLATQLRLKPAFSVEFSGHGQTLTPMAITANAVAQGLADSVVVYRALSRPATSSYHETQESQAPGTSQWTKPWGLWGPLGAAALEYQEYLDRFGATRESMAAVVVEARRRGSDLPQSVWHGRPITVAEYLEARLINGPISLLDCDMPVQAAGAVVVTRLDKATHLPHIPVMIAGYAQARPVGESIYSSYDRMMTAGQATMRALWASTAWSLDDVDFAQPYDGFSPYIYYWLEAMGYCRPGEAHLFANQRLQDDDFPFLLGGGSLGGGRLHGLPQLIECYLQTAGRAGDRQLHDAAHTVACQGAPDRGAVLALARHEQGPPGSFFADTEILPS